MKTTEIPRLSELNRERYKARRRERQARYIMDQTQSGEAHRFYNSPVWKNTRQAYLMGHPIDELQLVEHTVIEGEHVHHLVKWFEQQSDELRWKLLTDPDNLITVTSQTHQWIHYAEENLTDEQKQYLKDRKEAVYEKYLTKGIKIVLLPDSNRIS